MLSSIANCCAFVGTEKLSCTGLTMAEYNSGLLSLRILNATSAVPDMYVVIFLIFYNPSPSVDSTLYRSGHTRIPLCSISISFKIKNKLNIVLFVVTVNIDLLKSLSSKEV